MVILVAIILLALPMLYITIKVLSGMFKDDDGEWTKPGQKDDTLAWSDDVRAQPSKIINWIFSNPLFFFVLSMLFIALAAIMFSKATA